MSSAADGDRRRPPGEDRIRFRDPDLLERALTHRSFSNEHRELRSPNNERLEFLGDTVLGLRRRGPDLPRLPEPAGRAPSRRSRRTWSRRRRWPARGRELQLGRYLRMGAGEARSGGSEKLSLLADAFEAIVAAIYLDGGLAGRRDVRAARLHAGRLRDRRRRPVVSRLQDGAPGDRRRGWACRCPSTASWTSTVRTTRRASSSRSSGTANPSRFGKGIFQARGAAKGGQGSVEEARPAAGVAVAIRLRGICA